MKNKLTSLLKTLVISTFILATAAAYADYYVVYDTSDTAARCDYVSRHHYRHYTHHYVHHYYGHSCHPRRCYTHRRSYPIKVYYAWQVLPNTNCNSCNSCSGDVPPSTYSCRHVEYPAHYSGYREYYTPTYTDSYNYNGDMRTADDDGS
jgi:hypothetical protein